MPPMPPDQMRSTIAPEPLAYRISDACRVAGIGKSLLYVMAAAGEIKLTKIRGRTVVLRSEIERVLAAGQRAT